MFDIERVPGVNRLGCTSERMRAYIAEVLGRPPDECRPNGSTNIYRWRVNLAEFQNFVNSLQ